MSACRKGLINVSSAGGPARGGNSAGHEGFRAVPSVLPSGSDPCLLWPQPSAPRAVSTADKQASDTCPLCVLSPLLASHAHTLTTSPRVRVSFGESPSGLFLFHVISPSRLKPLCSWSPRSAVLAPPPALAFLTPPPPLCSLVIRTLSGARHF